MKERRRETRNMSSVKENVGLTQQILGISDKKKKNGKKKIHMTMLLSLLFDE